jgi:carboxymethylenebutenolidase
MDVPGAVGTTPLDTSDIAVNSGGGEIDAYLARPEGSGPRPGIIVIHEAFGPVEHIFDVTRRFAAAGYDAVAPNLYTRTGAPDPTDMGTVMPKMLSLPDGQVVADLEACAATLRALETSNGAVGCIGFCSGGRQTLLFACSSRAVDAAVDCWGGFIDRGTPDAATTPARPTPVLDLVGGIACPLLAVGGEEDQNPSPAVLADLLERAKQAGKDDVAVHVYGGAGHAFFADYRPSYRAQQAFQLWAEVGEFFGRHLQGAVAG